MKPRIKIDTTILAFIIILTGFLCQFPRLYLANLFFDDVLDLFGFIFILQGTSLRMIARGHKKAHSQKSRALVSTGIYSLTRNPMYLGSFFIGMGFVCIVWPWWAVPAFAGLFYLRFRRQIRIEEEYLQEIFGQEYLSYCQRVPRLFPSLKILKGAGAGVVNLREAWDTKEKRGLLSWPALAILLEWIQEKSVFGVSDWPRIANVFILAVVIFSAVFLIKYQEMSRGHGKSSE
ncbi:MAG: isoprenylcysteine carboxylmethyltransferase family protein [Candidatus Omnitrophota bacterium]